MANPVFKPTEPYGEIRHGEMAPGVNPQELPRYTQGGHYFKPDGSYHSNDGTAKKATASPTVAPSAVQTKPGVQESEVRMLLEDPRAEELLKMPRDRITRLVNAARGPIVAGEGSHQMMVAWLIKNTKDEAEPAKAKPALLTSDDL